MTHARRLIPVIVALLALGLAAVPTGADPNEYTLTFTAKIKESYNRVDNLGACNAVVTQTGTTDGVEFTAVWDDVELFGQKARYTLDREKSSWSGTWYAKEVFTSTCGAKSTDTCSAKGMVPAPGQFEVTNDSGDDDLAVRGTTANDGARVWRLPIPNLEFIDRSGSGCKKDLLFPDQAVIHGKHGLLDVTRAEIANGNFPPHDVKESGTSAFNNDVWSIKGTVTAKQDLFH